MPRLIVSLQNILRCITLAVAVVIGTASSANAITCERGYYRSSEDATECAPCPVGTYDSVLSDLSCATPNAGWYASGCAEGGTACTSMTKCPAGYFCTDGIIQGTCPAGTFSSEAKAACTVPDSGWYPIGCAEDGTACTSMSKCPAGYTCDTSAVLGPCPLGTYSITGELICRTPDAGWYASSCAEDGTACHSITKCPVGHFCTKGILTPCSGQLEYQDTTQQTLCKKVSIGYYKVDDTAQEECDDGYGDIAAPSRDECVGTFTKTGVAVEPAEIDGCASSTVGTCTPSTCQYTKQYDGTILTDCVADCEKPRTCNACDENRYLTNNTCPACSALGNGEFTYSVADNSNGAAACYHECNAPCVQSDCPQNATCTYGDEISTGKMYYGTTSCAAPDLTCSIRDYVCNAGHQKTYSGVCAQICTAGFSKLRTDTGVTVPLYNTKQTSPALTFMNADGNTCYANLVQGTETGTINLEFGDKIYHTVY